MNPYQITSSPYHRFIPSLRALKLSSLSALALSALLFSGCEVDEESENQNENPMSCRAMPECGPDQREVDSCEGEDDSCQEVTMCEQTIFCADIDPEICGAVPPCSHIDNSIERDSCEDAVGECYEVTGCGQTTYCEVIPANPCAEEISCGEGYMEVESCEGQEGECFEATCGEETTYCAEVGEITCQAAPSCALDELGSDEPCLDNGETCRAETMCEQTIYCRPAREVALLYCEEPIAAPIGIDSARVEADQLFFSLMLSGGCGFYLFPGCFSDFQESAPVQVSVTLGLEGEDPCDGISEVEPSLDLSLLKRAYQDAYQTDTGVIILNIVGYDSPLEYSF